MKHIFKLSNKFFPLILLVSIGFSDSNFGLLDSVSTALYKDGGSRFDATIRQYQIDNKWTDYATIEILDSTKFILIASDQTIKVDADTIFTFNPNTKQVVIDYYYRSEFNILSMLSGNLNQIKIGEIQKRQRDTIINFTIPQIESQGKIWINSKSYLPIRIALKDDLDNRTIIKIHSIKVIGIDTRYKKYSIEGWETIDLRE